MLILAFQVSVLVWVENILFSFQKAQTDYGLTRAVLEANTKAYEELNEEIKKLDEGLDEAS